MRLCTQPFFEHSESPSQGENGTLVWVSDIGLIKSHFKALPMQRSAPRDGAEERRRHDERK